MLDAEVSLLTKDMVDANDVAFLGVFPYLAPANVPEPSSAILLLIAAAAGTRFVRRRTDSA